MSIFDFFGIGKKKEVNPTVAGANILLEETKKTTPSRQTTVATTGAGSVAEVVPAPKIDFFAPKTKVAEVKEMGKIGAGEVNTEIPKIDMLGEKSAEPATKEYDGFIGSVMQQGSKALQQMGYQTVEHFLRKISPTEDMVNMVPEKYKGVVREHFEQKFPDTTYKKLQEKDAELMNNPEFTSKFDKGIVTAIKDKDRKTLSNPEFWGEVIGQGLGGSVPSLAIAIATKNPSLATMAFFPQMEQDAYEDISTDKDTSGLPEGVKEGYALTVGALNTIIEGVGMNFLTKPFLRAMKKEIVSSVLKSPLIGGIKSLAMSMGSEGLEEIMQQTVSDVMAKFFGSERAFKTLEEYGNIFSSASFGVGPIAIAGGVTEFNTQSNINKEIMAKPVEKGEKFQEQGNIPTNDKGNIKFDEKDSGPSEMGESELKKSGFGVEAVGYGNEADIWYINGKPAIATHYGEDGIDGIDGISIHKDFRNQGLATRFLKEEMNRDGGKLNIVSPNVDIMGAMKKAGNVTEIDYDIFTITEFGKPTPKAYKEGPVESHNISNEDLVKSYKLQIEELRKQPRSQAIENRIKKYQEDINEIQIEIDDRKEILKKRQKKNLKVIHNTSFSKLRKSLDLGGLPLPSLAITKKGIPFEGFGEISFIGDKEMVTPSKDTHVYAGDVYTTRVPQAQYNKRSLKDVKNVLSYEEQKIVNEALPNVDNTRSIQDVINNLNAKNIEGIDDIISKLRTIDKPFLVEKDLDPKGLLLDFINFNPKIRRQWIASEDMDDFNMQVQNDYELYQIAEKFAEREGFDMETDGVYDMLSKVEKEGTKLNEYNLKNVVSKAIKELKLAGDVRGQEGWGFQPGRIQGLKKFKDIADIKSKEDLLRKEDEVLEASEIIDKSTQQTLGMIIEGGLHDYNQYQIILGDLLKEQGQGEITKAGISKVLEENGQKITSKNEVAKYGIPRLIEELGAYKGMLQTYFEAKKMRSVDMQEFKAVAVPKDSIEMLRSMFSEKGIKIDIIGYDPKITDDRTNKIEEYMEKNDLLFQEQQKSSTTEKATAEDIAKAQKLLPEATYKTVEQIVNPKTGLPAYGSYLDGMITFAKTLTKTTAYHEVFHAYFDMFTDQKTQREIIEIVKKQQDINNDLDAEERLAEKFAENAVNLEKGIDTKGNYKILDFLDKLRATVKSVFSDGAKIKKLYNDIMEGKRPAKPSQDRILQKKFQEKSKIDEIIEGMDPLSEDLTKKGKEYLDTVEPTLKEIEEITAETTNFRTMTDKELDKFYESGRYDKLSDFEQNEFDNIMNKRVFVNPMQFTDPERQRFIDRIAKLEAREQRIGKVGKNKVSKEKSHQQSIEVDRERESIIEDIQAHYQFESTNDAYDMYAQLRDVPISQIKYEPRKGEYVSKAEKQRRVEKRVDKMRNETLQEKERRVSSIMGNVMTQARERGNQVTEVKAMMTMLDVKKGEMPPPLVKENNLSEDFYNNNKLSEKERKEVLKSKSEVKKGFLERRSKYIKPIGTQLENISKSAYARIKKYDYDVVTKGQQDMQEALPFLEGITKLKKENIDEYFSLWLALYNRDIAKAKSIMEKYSIDFPKILLEKMYNEGEDAGFNIGHLEDYFPRMVKDSKGLIGALRKSPERTYIEDAIRRIEQMREEKLTIEEEGEIINALLLGRSVDGVMIGSPNMKERSIELVKKDLLQYYYPPEQALTRYLGSMRDAIEVGKLFGNSGEFDTSLGLFIAQEVADGKIAYEDAEKVRELLEAKFEKTKTNPFINWMKTVGYSASLGSFSSTITQLGDLSFSFIENGVAKTLKAYGKSIAGKSELKTGEFGIDDIGQEFRGEGIAKKILSTILKGTGFSWMDKRGKETYINSTFSELKSLAKKNDVALSRDLAEYYGESKAKQIMKDLKEGKSTDDVRTYIFLKLCNIQPLTSTEMPIGYHKNPVFYMLKSFALKQIDYITKKGIKYAIANPKKGIPRLARIMFFIMMMNGLSDELKNITLGRKYNSVFYRLLNGEDVGPALSSLFRDNLLKMLGLTKYSIYEAKTDGIAKAFTNIILSIPPLQVPGNIISDLMGAINGKTSFEDLKSIQMIPWVGKPMYRWVGKGQASQQKSMEKESNEYAPSSGGL